MRKHLIGVAVLAALALAAGDANAQSDRQENFPELDSLDKAIGGLDSDEQASNDRLGDEIEALRMELKEIRAVLDGKLQAIAGLEDENEKLRRALRVRYGRETGDLPAVPMPDRDLIEEVLNDPRVQETRRDLMRTESPGGVDTMSYTVVSEWGRSPEIAAQLQGNVSSLIGMAVTVPARISEESLRAVGKHIRKKYEYYDNINIEIFDNIDAARQFADFGTVDKGRRVMSISKHRHSERNVILLYRGSATIEVR